MLESYLTQTATKLVTYRDAAGDIRQKAAANTTYSCMFRSITPFLQNQNREFEGFQGMVWFGAATVVEPGSQWIMPDGLNYRASSVTLAERRLGQSGTTQFVKVMLNSVKALVS